jgi:hypothetical protein
LTSDWTTPELLTIPEPVKDRLVPPPEVIVKGEAPGLKTTLSSSTVVLIESAVTSDAPKDAISDELFGTVLGTQLAAVFQSSLEGLLLQVALAASLVRGMRRAAVTQQRARPGFP